MYAAVDGDGVYQFVNGGVTWAKLPGSPVHPLRFAARGGTLYVTHSGGVGVRDANASAWRDITLDAALNDYNGISINPRNLREMVVSRGSTDKSVPVFFLSGDSGATWTPKLFTITNNMPWYGGYNNTLPSVAAIEFDPFTDGRVWLTNWFATYRAENIRAAPNCRGTVRARARGSGGIRAGTAIRVRRGRQPTSVVGRRRCGRFRAHGGLRRVPETGTRRGTGAVALGHV